MGKADRQKAENMTGDNNSRAIQQGQATQNDLKSQLDPARAQAQDTYNTASGAYKGMGGPTGAYDPAEYSRVQGQNDKNIQTGGFDADRLATMRGTNDTNTKTGGYDPNDVSKVNAGYDQLTANGMGGIDRTSAGTIRAGYTGLATNGGIDQATSDAMLRRTASGVQSVYSTMGTNLARQQSAQGMGGGGGETAQMARQAGNTAGEALTNTQAEIGKLQQTGKIAGLGGLSGFEQGAAAGQREAVAGEAKFATDQAGNRLTAEGQSQSLEGQKAQGTLSASQANQELATGAANQKIAAAGGLVNLYNSSPGYVSSLVSQILQSQSLTGTLTTEQAQIMQELSKQPGLYQNIMNGIATVGGAAAGVMGGMGKMGVKL